MCGIAGLWRFHGEPIDPDRLQAMIDTLAHRGPDGEGLWIQGSVGLAHRRLAIVDLSEGGAQPMVSSDGNVVVTFNGEIYNYQDLRRELEQGGVVFRSTSDTEVLLHLYEREGEQMLSKLRGMFAFAMWDADRQRLFFARDRIGKKPFFYRHDDQSFAFASEIKALITDHRPSIDLHAIRLFLGLQYVPAPLTGFTGIHHLPPGHAGTVEAGRLRVWSYHQEKREPNFTGSFDEAASEVRRLLEEAVHLRMIADVPVGTFLSGGVDSTAIAAIMARSASHSIKTFTMGFPSLGFDERKEAEAFARSINSEHHVFEATAQDACALVDTMVTTYDAPYADSSAIPTWLLARATRIHVKAVMTGDGGDELFAGYRRYRSFLIADALKRSGFSWMATNAAWMRWMVDRDPQWKRFAQTLEGIRRSPANGYADLFCGSYFGRDDVLRLLQPAFRAHTEEADAGAFVVRTYHQELGVLGALDFDLRSYLPDDLNVKMDRASMAHGLEARSPFLDQELVRFASHLPLSFLLKNGTSKRVLRAALQGIVPEEVFRRPKRGFQVPLAAWFRGELSSVFQERCLVSDAHLLQIIRPEAVQKLFEENRHGINHGNRLWMLLMLETWLAHHA